MGCKATNYGAPGSHPPEVITQDEDNRFVSDEQIQHWDNGTAGQAQYMSLVFQRATLVPDTPTGGEFQYPIPDGGLWTNTPLPGSNVLYITTRLFTTDGESPQQSVWAPPRLFVQHGDTGATGSQGIPGIDGIQGNPGVDGTHGSDGVNGDDGVSIIWLGDAASHPIGAVDGNAYYNTVAKKSYVYWDGAWYQMTIDGFDGQDGVSIIWKGDSATPPVNPEINWAYRDTDNGQVYIYNSTAWELMIQDGNDGAAGANGIDGLSVYITYHDDPSDGPAPTPPNNIDGTNNGWHTNVTSDVAWMSQKVDDGTGIGWSLAILIYGRRGSAAFSIESNDANTPNIGAATVAEWVGTLTNAQAQNVANDIIASWATDGYLRSLDQITLYDITGSLAATRVFLGTSTSNFTTVTAAMFSDPITEVIDGNLLINGSVIAEKLGAGTITAALEIIAPLLKNALVGPTSILDMDATNPYLKMIDGDGNYVLTAPGSMQFWQNGGTSPIFEFDGTTVFLRNPDGTILLQSGGNLALSDVSGAGAFAALDKILTTNISTYIDNLAIGTAQIGNLSVSTLKVVDNAITVPVGASSSTDQLITTTAYVDSYATVNIDMNLPVSLDGNVPVMIIGFIQGYGIVGSNDLGDAMVKLVYNSSTQIGDIFYLGGTVYNQGLWSFVFKHTPGTGSRNYKIQIRNRNSIEDYNVVACGITVLGIKK